ncbi:hypothetical protein ASF04_13870 [Duganella sp. Leaf61]|nr:hypothetical protein ASF04_13870 [Duganella sp. Leaf61]
MIPPGRAGQLPQQVTEAKIALVASGLTSSINLRPKTSILKHPQTRPYLNKWNDAMASSYQQM